MNYEQIGTTSRLTPEDYEMLFKGKEAKALEQALDIRKFEIELYWKRATYFWTFIGVSLTAYFAINAIDLDNKIANRELYSLLIASLGMVFSVAWFLVNKGSKYWQENWEKHVDVLEDKVTGPLYKTVLSRNDELKIDEKIVDFLTGPSPLSVSKINQLISFYIAILWIGIWLFSIPSYEQWQGLKNGWLYILIIVSSIAVIFSFWVLGGRYSGGLWHFASLRKSRVKPIRYKKSYKTNSKLKNNFWFLSLVWFFSGLIAANFKPTIDPEWSLMVPAGIFLGGIIFLFFVMLDNITEIIKSPFNLMILFLVSSIFISAIIIFGIKDTFSPYWNLWFFVVPYLYQRIYFGANKLT